MEELEWWGPDDYANPHARQVATPPIGQDPLIKGGGAGHALSHDPFSDGGFPGRIPRPEVSSGNGANPLHNYSLNQVFFETGRFKRKKTGAFSRVLLGVKIGKINWSCGTPGWPGMPIWPKNKWGSMLGKNDPVFPGKLHGICRPWLPAGPGRYPDGRDAWF